VPQEPNLFVVGDDDQAIYRFQGANLQNILRFRERFPKAAVITLTESYRSTQRILDAAGRLISQNTERLVGRIEGLTKDLHAASNEEGIDPVLLRAPSDMAEPWVIADLIEDRLKKDIPATEIAVITQTNGELRGLFDVFMARGLPVRMTGKADLLTHSLVLQAIAMLRAVHKPTDNALLADAISSDCLQCHPADLGHVYRVSREKKTKILDVLLSLDQSETLLPGIQFKSMDLLIKARDLILDLHQKQHTKTVVETLERIIHDGGLIPSGATIHPLDLAAIQEFFDRVRCRMIEEPAFTAEDFMRELEFYSNPDYSQLRMTYELPHLVTDGIQLMTAHQSKGKEFDVVFLVNFREGHWDKRRNPGSLSLPEDLLFGWEKDQKTFEQHQDERRVAYVAMTRARSELILSCPRELTTGVKTREVAPSAFFAEAGPIVETDGSLREPEKASTLLLKKPPKAFDTEFRDFLTHKLDTFALSASGLNRFLKDPIEFLRIDLLQVPTLSGYALAYGNAVHWALRQWGLRMQRGLPMDPQEFLGEFRNFLLEREFLADKEMKSLLYLGEESLPRYFESRLRAATPYIERVEGDFNARLLDTTSGLIIPIKGKVDRIDRDNPESAHGVVIDYKTGRPQTESQIREGDYFRQLQFYAVLLELGYPSLTPRAFILDFIGEREEHPIERSFVITEDDKKQMKTLIQDVWGKITALDFTPL
jgi:DNA helicase-2/ATP-dependent DNA helicase PcrA